MTQLKLLQRLLKKQLNKLRNFFLINNILEAVNNG